MKKMNSFFVEMFFGLIVLSYSEKELEVRDTSGPRQRSFITSLRTMPCDILR